MLVGVISCSPTFSKQLRESENFKQGFTGLAIYDLNKGQMLFEYNSDKYFIPASNIKLLTFYTGLHYLEDSIPTFKYRIAIDSLIFTTTGDPSFLNPKFNNSKALKFLQRNNLQLYYVKSNWQDEAFGSGWAWDDYSYDFSAEKSAFPVYGNLVTLQYNAESRSAAISPEFFKDSIETDRSVKNIFRKKDANTFYVNDFISTDYSTAIPFITSEKTSLDILRLKLDKTITFIENEKLLRGLNKKFYSVSANDLYKEMLQESDNSIAEQLLLQASLKISDTLNSDIIISQVQKKDFKDISDEIFWVDGSGLSRYNMVTPRSMVEVLEKIHISVGEKKMKSLLPAAGKEGTMKSFLSEHDPFIYAKSGSLRNNYSLSGILISKKGKTLLFSFMNSNYPVSSQKIKAEMAQILLKVRNKY